MLGQGLPMIKATLLGSITVKNLLDNWKVFAPQLQFKAYLKIVSQLNIAVSWFTRVVLTILSLFLPTVITVISLSSLESVHEIIQDTFSFALLVDNEVFSGIES